MTKSRSDSDVAPAALAHPANLSMLEKRRIEAEILKHVYDTLVESHGEQQARETIAQAVRRSSIEQAQRFVAQSDQPTSLQSFIELSGLWEGGGALKLEVNEKTDTTYAFDVVRCRYAEMYKEMGLGDIGHLLSCQRDGTFCEGYDPRLKFSRSQTIMQGASHCDFRYTWDEKESS